MMTLRRILTVSLCTLLVASLSLNAAERRKHSRELNFGTTKAVTLSANGERNNGGNRAINAYGSLLDGSENHLRAYVGRIETMIGTGNYKAQYLTQKEVNAILGR